MTYCQNFGVYAQFLHESGRVFDQKRFTNFTDAKRWLLDNKYIYPIGMRPRIMTFR